MVLRGVGACGEDQIGEFDLIDGICHSATAECGGQTGHRNGVSKAGAVIYIVPITARIIFWNS
jgi:hypothetical protein